MLESNRLAAVVLAAGRGKRMGTKTPKVLQLLAGKPLIYYTLQKLQQIGIKNIFVVLHYKAHAVKKSVGQKFNCKFVYQKKLLGTADALNSALGEIPKNFENVLVLNGDDSAFYSPKTLNEFLDSHKRADADLSFMTLKLTGRAAIGRVIRDGNNHFQKILEHNEYLDSGLFSEEINCGSYIFRRDFLDANITKIQKSGSGEYYLTELLGLAVAEGAKVNTYTLNDEKEWFGINTQEELEQANKLFKRTG